MVHAQTRLCQQQASGKHRSQVPGDWCQQQMLIIPDPGVNIKPERLSQYLNQEFELVSTEKGMQIDRTDEQKAEMVSIDDKCKEVEPQTILVKSQHLASESRIGRNVHPLELAVTDHPPVFSTGEVFTCRKLRRFIFD
jgi:hypothetical protein